MATRRRSGRASRGPRPGRQISTSKCRSCSLNISRAQIDELAAFKLGELAAQRGQIDAGGCPVATDEDGEALFDSRGENLYMLNSDGVINFTIGEEEA